MFFPVFLSTTYKLFTDKNDNDNNNNNKNYDEHMQKIFFLVQKRDLIDNR